MLAKEIERDSKQARDEVRTAPACTPACTTQRRTRRHWWLIGVLSAVERAQGGWDEGDSEMVSWE